MEFYYAKQLMLTSYDIIIAGWTLPLWFVKPDGELTVEERSLPYRVIDTGPANAYNTHECFHRDFHDTLEWYPIPPDAKVVQGNHAYDMGISLPVTEVRLPQCTAILIADGRYGPFTCRWWPATSAFWDLTIEKKGPSIHLEYWTCSSTRWRPEHYHVVDWYLEDGLQKGSHLMGPNKDSVHPIRDYVDSPLDDVVFHTTTNPKIPDIDSLDWISFQTSFGGQVTLASRPHVLDDDQRYILCRKAVNDLDIFGINVLENLASLPGKDDIVNAAPKLFEKIRRAVDNGITDKGKLLSDLYLTKKYGWDNLIRDVVSIKSGVRTLQEMIQTWITHCRASLIVDDTEYHVTIRCCPLDDGIYWTTMLGINVRPSTLWACVPFSFAVDWVLHGGYNLEEIETAYDWGKNRWNVSELVYSSKFYSYLDVPPINGWFCNSKTVRMKQYVRWVEYALPSYAYQYPDYGISGLKNHVFEIGALTLNAF